MITPWHGPRRKHRLLQFLYCCAGLVFIVICLFAKALLCNGCVYLLIKNLLPSSGCCFIVSRSLPSNGSTHYNIYTHIYAYLIHVNTTCSDSCAPAQQCHLSASTGISVPNYSVARLFSLFIPSLARHFTFTTASRAAGFETGNIWVLVRWGGLSK
jgi:hypothetical protein